MGATSSKSGPSTQNATAKRKIDEVGDSTSPTQTATEEPNIDDSDEELDFRQPEPPRPSPKKRTLSKRLVKIVRPSGEDKTNISSENSAFNPFKSVKGGTRRRKKRRWSNKYKKSINCRRPKGFSQKQYCKYGRKKQTRRRNRKNKNKNKKK